MPFLVWGLNLSHFGSFVPGYTQFLQTFLGYETGMKNIRVNRESYRSLAYFSM